MISQTNEIWINQCAKEIGTSPDIFLNLLLLMLQNELGISEGNIKEWLTRPKKLEIQLRGTLSEITEARVAAEETARTIQLYITQIQNRIKQPTK